MNAQISILDEIIVDNFPKWAVKLSSMEELERMIAV